MRYQDVVPAVFVARPNRFLAICRVRGQEITVHVKNTGRCKELLIPGAQVYLEKAVQVGRKTPYSLIAVEKGKMQINLDSQAPNKVVAEAWLAGKILLDGLPDSVKMNKEVVFGSSRFDFAFTGNEGQKMYVEVKGVTLEEDGIALFPDAPTERGVRHLEHLEQAVRQGDAAGVIFIVQMEKADAFSPNDKMHARFGEVLRKAVAAGVFVQAYTCLVKPDELILNQSLPVIL